jgi:mRNA-degrading endonuclease RelE of RelBE toxin-antitoxin system
MSFEVKVTARFKRQTKRLLKKYNSIKGELDDLLLSLETNPTQGTSIGHSCYKIRLSISAKGKGKSGGARVITHYYVSGGIVYLLSIYDKSEQPDITDKELQRLLGSL